MAKLEIDYSLPYEEAKKKYGHNGYFMSEDQYNFNKASAEKQAKMNAGTANWWEQKGEADKIIENLVGKENPTHEEAMAKIQETAEQRLTPEQQGVQAKGNPGDDHINNPNEADTADLVKVQQALEKLSGQKDSYTPEEIEAAKNEAGITKNVPGSASANNNANTTLTDSVTEVTTPKKDDPPEVQNDKKRYNKAMMSIWDAYRAGEISKETAGYFTIDAIATLAKNLGRSIGNVGAQFSGGTIDNGHDESKWGQRQNALLNEEIGMETESLGGAAGRKAESENIANLEARIRAEYSPQMLDLEIKNLENEVKKSGIDVTKAENSQALIEHIKQDPYYEDKPLKMLLVGFLSQTGVGGAVNTGASALEKLALLRGK